MSKHESFINTVDRIVTDGVTKGILHLTTEDVALVDNKIQLKGKQVVNFGSCSYLGLEFNHGMIEAAKQATEEYGTQFSASRAYVSSSHYEKLEEMFDQIFDAYTVVAPTTTLGHIATIPIIIEDDDAVILDHQAHNSMQNAVNLVKTRGVHVEMIRHNNMEMLEERIKKLRQKHKRIWYFADGIFSMYGDYTPVNEVYKLMDKYPELHYYVDDAHGMSCFGKHGRGYVLDQHPIHERMIFTTSLAKAFATGGAVLVFPNRKMATKIRTCGAPFLSSGPMQPAALGAALASAKIHLSDKIYKLQDQLQENINYCNSMLRKHGLPNASESNSPVFFIGVGLPKMGYNMIHRLLNDGFYLNLGIFPTVPMKNTGIRFTITRLHTFEQIESMIKAMAHHYPLALEEEGFTLEKVYKAFKMKPTEDVILETAVQSLINQADLKVQHENSIVAIDKQEWDQMLGNRGSFNWNGMNFLENSFKGNSKPEENWEFDYIIIRDQKGSPILATFFTMTLSKDDMLSPSEISKQIEEMRNNSDPHYLVSKTLIMGSMLTEGNHLYIDRSSNLWKDAMQLLFDKIVMLQELYKTSVVQLRDLDPKDEEMDSFLIDNGFFKVSMPENHVVEDLTWENEESYLATLSYKSRKHVRQNVLRHYDKYQISFGKNFTKKEIQYWYELYLNVKNNSLDLNTFPLPIKTFEKMAVDPNWDILTMRLKPEYDKRNDRQPVAIIFSYIGTESYCPVVIGLDYQFQKEFQCYRQALYQLILRAKKLGSKHVRLGFSASIEKRKFNTTVKTPAVYIQTTDNYNLEVLGTMSFIEKEKGVA